MTFLIAAKQKVASWKAYHSAVSDTTQVAHITRVVWIFIDKLPEFIGRVREFQCIKRAVIERMCPVYPVTVAFIPEIGNAIWIKAVEERAGAEGPTLAVIKKIAVIYLDASCWSKRDFANKVA